jgi:hypothetical protein
MLSSGRCCGVRSTRRSQRGPGCDLLSREPCRLPLLAWSCHAREAIALIVLFASPMMVGLTHRVT